MTALWMVVLVGFVICSLSCLIPKEQRPNARILSLRDESGIKMEVTCPDCGAHVIELFDPVSPVVPCRECGLNIILVFSLEDQKQILAAYQNQVAAAAEDVPHCRVCGCTDEHACPGGCCWVEDPEGLGDLCSRCADELPCEEEEVNG